MTRSALAIAIATVLIGSTALAEHPATQMSIAQPHQEVISDTMSNSRTENAHRDTTNRSDERFLKDFAQFNAAEVKTGKLAEYKTEYAEVKAFALHMVEVHSKAIGKIEAIAAQANVNVKAKPALMQKAQSALLDINVGASFDRAYMKAMIDDHEELIEILEKEIKDGQDANIKQLASEALADAQAHLKMAQDLNAKVADEHNAKLILTRNSSGQKVATAR